MPKFSLLQSNFTGGELSPALALGRVDIAKYNNGVKRLENCQVTVQGGAKRRPGTRFIAATKIANKRARLIEFVYNRGQAYVLELGDGYMRFFADRAQIVNGTPVEVVSPYTEAQLPAVNYVQKADTAFFVQEGVFPHRLQRFSTIEWRMGVVPFITPAFEEQGQYPLVSLQFTIAPGIPVPPGTYILTAAAAIFLRSDVGRLLSANSGTAKIIGYTSNTAVTVQVLSTFKNRDLFAGSWNLEGSPQDSIAPSSKGQVGQLISLNANFTYLSSQKTITAFVSGYGTVAVEVTGHGYVAGDTVNVSGTSRIDGNWVVNRVIDANHFNWMAPTLPDGILGTTGTVAKIQVSADSEVWQPTDVGSYVNINGGLVEITEFVNVGTVNGRVLRELAADVPAGANAWTLEQVAWNASKGYPRAVTINKQRLMFAGSPGYPQHVWGSEIQGYLNFQFGTADDQAFRFEIDGPRNSPIRHLAPAKQLLVLTEADEMSLKGGQEKPITPTNIQKTDESTVGAGAVRPIKVGNEMVFVQAAGKKIAGIGYRYEIDGFDSPDRTIFASHITGTGVVQLAHQKEPDSTLYAVRADGQLAACAYDISQEVTGWGRWITQGSYESVACVPTAIGEDTYAIVARTVGGSTVRYVEVFDPDMLVDCGITGTSVGGQATWTGLGHLEGMVVQAWADGAYMGEFTVTGGQITLQRNANSVQIGLGFTCLVEMLQPEVGGNGSTAQGSQVHVNEVIIRTINTKAALINGQPIDPRRFGEALLDQPIPDFDGDVRVTTLSDEMYRTSQIITQPYPLPFHLLDVIRSVTINN
ncbi:hypothetical protein H4CHR_01574 [Variovorax sp. PBS-H4]|uniref:hypothetical protein n=1 Tax=Variovorax sp. PBS-H4 TaxID=434008 RepID=UPI00131929F8|nr:hypothetical protein [Variovorax sp. PBS-H4]VTU25338.1 hypothetical protein H4CHR_01574 [Variovorax sp. PBS-H4]